MLKLKPNYISTHLTSTFPIRLSSSFNYTDQTNYINRQINHFFSHQTTQIQTLLKSHAHIITSGNQNNVFIASKLISLYTSLRDDSPDFSTRVFDSFAAKKDTFLWNSIIKSHFCNGDYRKAVEFYLGMRFSNTPPDHFTVPMIVSACAELTLLDHGKNVHGLVSKLGVFGCNSAVGSSFVYLYSKCGVMEDARNVFVEITKRDVVAWTALIIGYLQNDDSENGLECLCEMHRIGGDEERPNFRTFEGGFQACAKLGAILEGRCLHGLVVKNGIIISTVVQSSTLVMYSKYGTLEEAHAAFSEVGDKDLIAWTSIISAYARLGRVAECSQMFSGMRAAKVIPDGVVTTCMLSGFGNSMLVFGGKAFHGIILRKNYEFDQVVNNALLSMYCKFGLLSFAEKIFDRVNESNKDSWNLMVYAYNKVGHEGKCIELFRDMKYCGIESDTHGLVSVISSCSKQGATNLGRSVHGYVIKNLMDENVSIANSLIDMYGRCGNLKLAWIIFRTTHRDVVTWNTLISVHIHNGKYGEALTLFDSMILENVTPNSATLVTVLSACSNLASLENGEKIYSYIKKQRFDINTPIATALIDMYAKCGKLEKSREIFSTMNEKDVISWNAMISGYAMHGDAESALEVFQQMELSSVKPNGLTFLALMSACTHAGLVEEGNHLFGKLRDYSIVPNLKHYACMVDLLGRSGKLQEAEGLVLSMPIVPDNGIWGTLLSACNMHNETEMGIRIAKRAIESDPENDGHYIMICNMYSSTGRWDEAEEMRERMIEKAVKKRVGLSAAL